ncbi:hypothetical protein [Achromobacter sp. 2789STDY5608621]|uniref:hypothetical protein n=1 Tax=Achromobacter sp. 2789STDY5608621 TaxID=1806496 RepID=UPI0006C37BAD|nr:hypothetical protein [Achromobacter sp. 2789STDY5608621]CUJ38200.1 Uncharacterised protein [Achromobacter sp. 2789STDY5608621]
MDIYERTFDWVPAAEGRARFAGGIRGWDERGHDTYAVEVDGKVMYGEIARTFLPNQNDFNIQIVSFGYGVREHVGMPRPAGHDSHARGVSDGETLQRVQSVLARLILAGLCFEDRPRVLLEYPHARFQGRLIFAEGSAAGAPARELTIRAEPRSA